MELKEAIENLKVLAEPQYDLLCLSDKESIKIVLEEVENKDEWYTKGYEEGYIAGSMEMI
jgi:hypothetical protein